jgi:hypothetical protein
MKAQEVKWVSEHYSCIVRCLLLFCDKKSVLWEDLAEITNALTFLISTEAFKNLPDAYPYTKTILLLREKLQHLCLSTQNLQELSLRFSFNHKYELLLQRYELLVFPKITFNQLLFNFSEEKKKKLAKTINDLKQEEHKEKSQRRNLRLKNFGL